MANISVQHFPLIVLDVDEALAFYRDGLGLEVVSDVANGDFRWVSLGVPGQPGLNIVLSAPGAGRSDADAQVIAEQVAKGAFGPLVFSVADLDSLFESLSASGAEVLQEPALQPWGPRDCAFRDPSGNMIRINQAA
ncbi:VOC family protein [Glutamicibacter halophytocola]|jgi:catechol 2,3-dioxygenase-like lactoylglutathione lyase family enzyme|uniref:VOC family protein n=1 Tax=Glutamicibacter halophytocola TaxID=1933880 RepID=A0ABX5YBI1_9MICC|nr:MULTISPECIES: VOC family protein [Glutamicibacter]MBF6673496.1 VOC family protein [Glutamicibacter sp. FBE19]QDY67025.1 VOC family protein [Glutamicibacter halophytocola]